MGSSSNVNETASDYDRNTEAITVEALSHSRTFADAAELGAFVEEALDHRGGIYDPFELAAIAKLAALANGQASGEVHRIARATAFHAPSRPSMETPFDGKISEACSRAESTEREWQDALAERRQVKQDFRQRIEKTRGPGAAPLIEAAGRAYASADQVVQLSQDVHARALAGRTALKLASDRWRSDRASRFCNAADPGKPLTLVELEERAAE